MSNLYTDIIETDIYRCFITELVYVHVARSLAQLYIVMPMPMHASCIIYLYNKYSDPDNCPFSSSKRKSVKVIHVPFIYYVYQSMT